MIDETKIGRTVVCNEEFQAWLMETPPFMLCPHVGDLTFEMAVLPGGHNREEVGATLFYRDNEVEWAEWYPDPSVAVLRLAAKLKAAETAELFRDGPEGFSRWAQNFFERTVCHTIAAPNGDLK